MSKRPNILFITSDQQRGDSYGFRGRKLKTPHLDRMAANGVSAENCITPNLVCQPSRASILTGMLPLTHGVSDNGCDLDPKVGEKGFAGTLAKAGYDTAFIGKGHFSSKGAITPTGTPECKHSSVDYGPDWSGPYMGFEHTELIVHGHFHRIRPPMEPPAGQHFERWFFSREDNVLDLWNTDMGPESGVKDVFNSALPVAWHSSSWVGDRTIDWLANRNKDNPFCMWASFPDPHYCFDCPAPWSYLHHPDEVDISQSQTRDLERRPWWHEATLNSKPISDDPEIVKWRTEGSRTDPLPEHQLRAMTANYFGMISLIDHNVGRILDALDAEGIANDTLVIFTSDHGDLLGDHGLYKKGPTFYEGLLNVGAIFRGPGVPAGGVIQDPVSTLDMAATFYDFADVEKPEGIQSESLKPLIEGKTGASRDVAYNEWHLFENRCGVALDLRIVRTKTHKCAFELESGAGELYDLVNDPLEMDNLYGDDSVRSVQKELQDMMRARPGKILDPLPEPIAPGLS
jgi:arylsulfatase A-like enzyme